MHKLWNFCILWLLWPLWWPMALGFMYIIAAKRTREPMTIGREWQVSRWRAHICLGWKD